MSVIDLSKVSELTLRNEDNDCQTVLKANNLWGNPVDFKQVKFPTKLAKNIYDFTCNYGNIGPDILPTLDKHWLFHLYMDENRDVVMDVFNGEDNGLVYLGDKAFIKGSNSFNITKDAIKRNINTKAFESLNKIMIYTIKNNVADIWYICHEWDYAYDVNNLSEFEKDIVKAILSSDGQGVDLLVEDVYKRGTAMIYKYPQNIKTGKYVSKGEYCLVIC